MKTQRLFGAAAIASSLLLAAPSFAQQKPDEVLVGPISMTHNAGTVPVTVVAASYFKIVSKADGLYLDARIEGDLRDLQGKFGAIVDTFRLPKDNCGSYKPDNLVVDLPTKSLTPQGSTAVLKVSGKIDVWSCFENPVPKTKIEWEVKNIGFGIKTKVPVVKTWPGDPIKTRVLSQPFEAALPVAIHKVSDRSVALAVGSPNIELKGQYVFITKGVLNIAGVDVNDEAKKALDKAIDPNSLVLAVPEEYAALNPVVSSVSFGEKAGGLMLYASLSAKLPVEKLNEFVRALVDHSKPH